MEESQRTIYEFSAPLLVGRLMSLAELRGRVLLIVNTATPPRGDRLFTPQFAGLEELFRACKVRGFEVLGFPCNQFGAQEPGIFGSERIKWNFTKSLVDRKGNLTGRYATTVEPKALAAAIEGLLEREWAGGKAVCFPCLALILAFSRTLNGPSY